MAPVPDQPEVFDRLDAVTRHLAYLDRRFDDTNARLSQAHIGIVASIDEVGTHVDTALERSSRSHAATLAWALVGQFLALLALVAGIGAWP
jgi:hypothetical protein